MTKTRLSRVHRRCTQCTVTWENISGGFYPQVKLCPLHAAAPEMLKALEGFERASHEKEPTALAMRIDTAAQVARAAIEKAKS